MPRAGRVQDWSLTLAIKDVDLTECPQWLIDYLMSDDVTRFFAIAEKAAHWHIHVGFSTRRKYSSDYTKWFARFHEEDVQYASENAVELRYHNDILQLVGGYCAKSDDEHCEILGNKGFTQEEIDYGAELYRRSLQRQRIRTATSRLVSIPREQFTAHLGYAMGELETDDPNAAIGWLVDAGFGFTNSVDASANMRAMQRYKTNYIRDRAVRSLHEESVADSDDGVPEGTPSEGRDI